MSALVPSHTRCAHSSINSKIDARSSSSSAASAALAEEQVQKDKEKLERIDYFEEEMEEERCGTCDNCVHPLEEQILVSQRSSATTQIDGHT